MFSSPLLVLDRYERRVDLALERRRALELLLQPELDRREARREAIRGDGKGTCTRRPHFLVHPKAAGFVLAAVHAVIDADRLGMFMLVGELVSWSTRIGSQAALVSAQSWLARGRLAPPPIRSTPVGGRAGSLRIAAVLRYAEAVAVRDHQIARRETRIGRRLHRADRVDAADAREAPDDAALAGGGKCILEVDAGVRDAQRHVARVEVAVAQFDEARLVAAGEPSMR